MTERATCWSVTINNPTEADEESFALARQKGWKVEGQRERGESGTEHYQLLVRTPQVRFAAVKKMFPRGHIEVARNPAALSQYVAKEETRVGAIQVDQGKYPSQAKFFDLVWDMILENPDEPEFRRLPSGRFASAQLRSSLITATRMLIRRGYVVENIATNPMTIQAWSFFHLEFLVRKTNSSQTDTASSSSEIPLATET